MLDIMGNAGGGGASATGPVERMDGVADGARNPRVIAVTGLTFEARIVAGPDIAVICGADRRSWNDRSSGNRRGGVGIELRYRGRARAHLKPGSCVIARHIIADNGRYTCDIGWSAR